MISRLWMYFLTSASFSSFISNLEIHKLERTSYILSKLFPGVALKAKILKPKSTFSSYLMIFEYA